MISDIHADIVSRRTGEAAARTNICVKKLVRRWRGPVLWTMAVI
jgi:hypothetical protein